MGWDSQTSSQKLLLSWDGSLGKGVLLSVFKRNGKSCSFCVPGQRASSEHSEFWNKTVICDVFSLALLSYSHWCPGGTMGPLLAGATSCVAGYTFTHLALLPSCPGPHIEPQNMWGEKSHQPEWRASNLPSRCWHFQPQFSVGGIILEWGIPPEEVPIKFLSVFSQIFPFCF